MSSAPGRSPGFKITRSISDLISQQRKPLILPETGWWKVGSSEPVGKPFLNSWSNATLPEAPPASWYLDENGEVKIRGKVRGGADNTVIWNLPEEVRPEYEEAYVCPLDEDGNVDLSALRFRAYQEGDMEV